MSPNKEKPNLSRKKIAQIPLSEDCKSLILGSLLGDGSLKKETGYASYANIRFKFRHSSVQKDYFYWKVELLKEIATKKSVQFQKADSGYSKNEKLLFQSSASPYLTDIWKIVCDNSNSLVIRRCWLNHLTQLSLAAWWFDDGSLMKATRQGVLCTDNFSETDCKMLSEYLRVTWDLNCKVRPLKRKNQGKNNYSKETYYRLWLNATEVKKLLQIVLPYAVTPFAVKKCFLAYKDPNFQQRWISKMKELLPKQGVEVISTLLENDYPSVALGTTLEKD